MNIGAWRNTIGLTAPSLPIVILYVTEGCNLRCAMCSYRAALPDELSLTELALLAGQLRELGLRRIVFSGGEPLTRKELPAILAMFGGVRRTLLTNGLQLERRLPELHRDLEEYIVSVDGATAATHDAIRGSRCFDQVVEGIRAAVEARPRKRVALRCVLQRRNFRETEAVIDLALRLGADAVSFLPVDVTSSAYGRASDGADKGLLLTAAESAEFARSAAALVERRSAEFRRRFVENPPAKFLDMAAYFGHWTGRNAPPRNDCNAPDVSAVITATGNVLPCFFLPPIGSIRRTALREILASPRSREIRRQVRAYEPEPCHRCTCTLKIPATRAILDRF